MAALGLDRKNAMIVENHILSIDLAALITDQNTAMNAERNIQMSLKN